MKLIRNKNLSKQNNNSDDNNESDYINMLMSVIESDDEVVTFLHNTNTEEIANKVLKEGFEFQSHLDFTTDVVSEKDIVPIKYFTIVRRAYGDFTLIIQISKQIIEEYSNVLDGKLHHFSEALSVNIPYEGGDGDLIYCLAPHFVKGFINSNTAQFFSNNNFNPNKKLAVFEDNIKKIISQENY